MLWPLVRTIFYVAILMCAQNIFPQAVGKLYQSLNEDQAFNSSVV